MSKLKAAVIGLGNIGLMYDFETKRPHPSSHTVAYQESPFFELGCVIDSDESKKKYLNKISPDISFFNSFESAFKNHMLSDIDVVSICTPPASHLEIIQYLLKKKVGRILFCEKPVVNSLGEINEVGCLMKEHRNVTIIPNISRRWNFGLRKVSELIQNQKYGKLEKINVRYTRGIYNTGSHLFDLLKMWTGESIKKVMTLSVTYTSAEPEKSYSFYFEQKDGVTGYAEAIDDTNYYLFDIDLFLSNGKIEMRNSGDDILCYCLYSHHLFEGFQELKLINHETGLLSDACLKNALENIGMCLQGKESPYCQMEDAFYPLYVADALERSYRTRKIEEVKYE